MQVYSDLNQALEGTGRPYQDIEVGTDPDGDAYVIRKFDADVDSHELYWHRDNEDRTVKVLESGQGWAFQFDNELPFSIEAGTVIFILRHEWHRVIKGSGDLLIKIYKHGR